MDTQDNIKHGDSHPSCTMSKWYYLRAINSLQPYGMAWLRFFTHFFKQKFLNNSFLTSIIHLANVYHPSTTLERQCLNVRGLLKTFVHFISWFSRTKPQGNQMTLKRTIPLGFPQTAPSSILNKRWHHPKE